ncbi:endothelial lipase [Folsomia candida]|uniref:Putative phospholipase A1 magnifin n=1 Tax=Folsomia candida TaxID=158441 RepID=A0A226DI37_FOLCA|nr:endothelial lipase [Folsomia candida]OXA44628.1 putative phospholipase A1 magnifin [Folsomia candida]
MPLHSLIVLSFVANLPLCANVLLPFEIGFNPDDIKFYLIQSISFKQEIKYGDELSLRNSFFKPGGLTVINLHGFVSPMSYIFSEKLIIPITESKIVDNFIIVDWSKLSGKVLFPPDIPLEYLAAIKNIKTTADRITNFIAWLTYNNYLNLDRIHIIGHSLGAHLAGRIGTEIQLIMGGRKLPRITGLDPAGPLYDSPSEWKIDKNDAYFVDVYHTNAGLAGDSSLDGHADFMLNGGHFQPGCDIISEFDGCSHTFANYWFAATFRKAYIGCQCSSRELDAANFQTCRAQCPNPVFAGVYVPHTTRGEYQVDFPALRSSSG